MFTGVIGAFDPLAEVVIELSKGMDGAQIAHEELLTDGAKEAFDFTLGGTVADGGVDENSAEADANLSELGGGVVGAVIDVNGFRHAAFVECGLEAVDEI